MNLQINNYAKKINELHNEIKLKLKTTVEDAIKIGELLAEVKNKVGHGNFLDWINDNCDFNRMTANKYMRCFTNVNQIYICNSLQEAYDKIEQIETHEKQIKQQQQKEMIDERIKTGKKPYGWDRSVEYKYQKKIKDNEERTERIEKAKQNKKNKGPVEINFNLENETDNILKEAKEIHIKLKERELKKEKLFSKMNLTGNNAKEPIYDALLEYLLGLEENVRLEACHNIIKFCKTIANELQRKSIEN